jgi:uncharacterized protein
MANNRAGGLHFKAKILARDPDFFKHIGKKGGSKNRPETRMFYKDRDLARRAGAIGGYKSRRGPDAKREFDEAYFDWCKRHNYLPSEWAYQTWLEDLQP